MYDTDRFLSFPSVKGPVLMCRIFCLLVKIMLDWSAWACRVPLWNVLLLFLVIFAFRVLDLFPWSVQCLRRRFAILVWTLYQDDICVLWALKTNKQTNKQPIFTDWLDVWVWLFGHMLFWVSYMHVFCIFVCALVQRNWACFTWKGALGLRSLLLFLLFFFLFFVWAQYNTFSILDGDVPAAVFTTCVVMV